VLRCFVLRCFVRITHTHTIYTYTYTHTHTHTLTYCMHSQTSSPICIHTHTHTHIHRHTACISRPAAQSCWRAPAAVIAAALSLSRRCENASCELVLMVDDVDNMPWREREHERERMRERIRQRAHERGRERQRDRQRECSFEMTTFDTCKSLSNRSLSNTLCALFRNKVSHSHSHSHSLSHTLSLSHTHTHNHTPA